MHPYAQIPPPVPLGAWPADPDPRASHGSLGGPRPCFAIRSRISWLPSLSLARAVSVSLLKLVLFNPVLIITPKRRLWLAADGLIVVSPRFCHLNFPWQPDNIVVACRISRCRSSSDRKGEATRRDTRRYARLDFTCIRMIWLKNVNI